MRRIFVRMDNHDWDEAARVAKRLEAHVRAKYASKYQDLTGNNFAVSCPAELAYGKWIGERPNFNLLKEGDGGHDFSRYHKANVKGTWHWRRPNLLIPEWQEIKPVRYVLVGLDKKAWRAVLCGWEHGDVIREQPLREWPWGDSTKPTRVILPENLKEMHLMKPIQLGMFPGTSDATYGERVQVSDEMRRLWGMEPQ